MGIFKHVYRNYNILHTFCETVSSLRNGTYFHLLKICPTADRRDRFADDVAATASDRPMSRHGERRGESPSNHKCSTQNCTKHPLQWNN